MIELMKSLFDLLDSYTTQYIWEILHHDLMKDVMKDIRNAEWDEYYYCIYPHCKLVIHV